MMRTGSTQTFLLWLLLGCRSTPGPLVTATPTSLAFPAPAEDMPRSTLPGRSLIVRDATVLDGRGGPLQEDTDVWIQDGIIHQIGVDLEVPDLPVIDANGMILLPGLIASHAHLQSVPGSVLRNDSEEVLHTLQKHQLRAYLASGVTSVFDPAISTETLLRLRAHLDAGGPGPQIFAAAPFITPADGYMTSAEMRGRAFETLWQGVDLDSDLDAMFAEAAPLDPVGVKVAIEDGVLFPNFPTFDDEMMARIKDASARAGARIFVHSISNTEHRRALELEPYAMVHVGLWDEPIAPDVLETLQERGTYVITTITLNHLASWGWSQAFAEDDWIRQRVPLVQWETATHPDGPRQLGHLTAEIMRPRWVPGGLARASASMFTPSEEAVSQATASGLAAVQTLHEAGVPWVVGADEGNAPAYTTFFHGVATQIELEQLDTGDLPRAAILAACTTSAAEMLGVSHRIGTIEVGKQADMLLVRDNPLEDGMVALRSAQWTIQRGEARTPAAWLFEP